MLILKKMNVTEYIVYISRYHRNTSAMKGTRRVRSSLIYDNFVKHCNCNLDMTFKVELEFYMDFFDKKNLPDFMKRWVV